MLFAKPLGSLIERFPKPMMFFFMGAVAGIVLAIALVFPGVPVGVERIVCVILMALGFFIIFTLGKKH